MRIKCFCCVDARVWFVAKWRLEKEEEEEEEEDAVASSASQPAGAQHMFFLHPFNRPK